MIKEKDITVLVEDLSEDKVEVSENKNFWQNVSEHDDGYILTEKVRGV